MAKLSLSKPTSGYNLAAINANFTAIEAEFQDKVLYRNNPVGEANTLQTDVDANGKTIYNLDTLVVLNNLSIGGVDLGAKLAEASASALAAEASATSASASASGADSSEASALNYSNSSAASYALAAAIAAALASGSIGFDAAAYDWGSVADATTYFNRDFGLIV